MRNFVKWQRVIGLLLAHGRHLIGLTSKRRRTDVMINRRRPTSQRRHLEFTVLRRHDVGIRRRCDEFMTS